MQIHEITRRKINEAGFAGGLATGVMSALGKVGVAGPDPSAFGQSQELGNTQLAAYKATASLVNTIATTMAKAWGQTVAGYIAQSKDTATGAPLTSIDQLDQASLNALKQDLYKMVNGAIQPRGEFDYNTLGSKTNEPDAIEQAKIIKTNITQDIADIWNNTLKRAKGSVLLPLWKQLATDGVAPAQNYLRFVQKGVDAQFRENPATRSLEILLPGKSSWEKFDLNNLNHLKAGREKGIIPPV